MLYSVETNFYPDGYTVEDVNCIDLSIAHAVGTFNKSYYYNYCLLLSIENIFGTESNIFDSRKVLKELGFKYLSLLQQSKKLTPIEFIKDSLNSRNPVLIHTNYECLYYSDGYKVNGVNRHAILITGYDDERQIIHIQDAELVENYEIQFTKGQIYYKGRIKVEMLIDIIESTKQHFNIDQDKFNNEFIYCLSQTDNSQLKLGDCGIVIDNMLKLMNNDQRIFSLHKQYEKLNDDDQINRFFYYSRRPFLGGTRVITDYFQRIVPEEMLVSYKKCSSDLITSVDIYLGLSQKEYLKDRCYYPKRLEKVTSDVIYAMKVYNDFLIKNGVLKK